MNCVCLLDYYNVIAVFEEIIKSSEIHMFPVFAGVFGHTRNYSAWKAETVNCSFVVLKCSMIVHH